MAETTEPRALGAALAGPAFATRGGGLAMHVANRHVERWAPETTVGVERNRPLRSLGFVDRLISPWVEAAQRSASLRMFSQYKSEGQPEGQGRAVSWVFPRPWYQDELDWMAAARQTSMTPQEAAQPSLFTTRGTYVAPASVDARATQTRVALPASLYEYVAPSLSVEAAAPSGVGYAGDAGMSAIERVSPMSRAYSPLVPLAAVQAAEVMSRTVARLPQTAQSAPALRGVLSTLLERSARRELEPTRVSQLAPELVTPPAPRPGDDKPVVADEQRSPGANLAEQVADRYAQQHVQIAELQRIARQSAERQQIEVAQQAAVQQAAQQATQAPATTQAQAVRATAQPGSMRTQTERAAEQQRVVDEARKAQADAQAQLEERVQRRVVERQAQKLHEQARSDAAAHARVEPAPATPVEPTTTAAASMAASSASRREAPPEVAAAIASLPPELASMLARRPDRAVQTIAELDQAYRAVELLARGAASGQAMEITRGPRLMLPSGLGGLVAAIDHAPAIASRGGVDGAQMAMAMAADAGGAAGPSSESFVRARTQRAPMLPWVAPRTAMPFTAPTSGAIAPSSALGAAATATPAALGHVAWSDRWLARFAGASTRSLETLAVSTSREGDQLPRVLGLAGNAPGAVFVSPSFHATGGFDAVRDAESVRFDARGHAVVTPSITQQIASATISAPTIAMPAQSVQTASPTPATIERFDDDAETPDDVFVSISAAAAQRRSPPVAVAPAPVQTTPVVAAAPVDRTSVADAITLAAPHSPSAGLAAQLAASPFAPALRHVLSIPSATSFDVRALFGGALSASYLAGLIAPESRELELAGTSSRERPTFASRWFATDASGHPVAGERTVEGFDAAYVSPDAPAIAAGDAMPEATGYAPATTLRSALLSWEGDVGSAPAAFAQLATQSPAALAAVFGPAGTIDAGGATTLASSGITATGNVRRDRASATAREMVGAMSQPLLGETEMPHTGGASWAAPGMLAERAFGWSVAQERSAADLSFDFVPPELVLAARVYGLGPAEAAQAARIAIAGPGQLAAMAGTVDRTFVQAMAFEAERRSAASSRSDLPAPAITAYPTSGDRTDAAAGRAGSTPSVAGVQPATAQPATAPWIERIATPSTTAFGVERRTPRGAFLWPPATVAALKLDAPAPDGQQSMSIAALELLAAQSVAELGTYAALGLDRPATLDGVTESGGVPMAGVDRPGIAALNATSATSTTSTTSATSERPVGLAEPSEGDVLSAAISMVPMARRARFDALYLALGRSSSIVSPAARAARALALAGRGEDAPISARERAASAWDVLPVVYAAEMEAFAAETAAAGTSAASGRAAAPSPGLSSPSSPLPFMPSMDMLAGRAGSSAPAGTRVAPVSARNLAANELSFVGPAASSPAGDWRPGLSTLSARAGEALGSYVAPFAPVNTTTPVSTRQERDRESGAVLRAPTAAQEMVQTGRPSGRFGGGEVEIPTWFEAAARKMFEQQSGGMGGDISIADLTLISSAPSNQIAASSRGTPGGAAANAPSLAQHSEPKPHLQIDVEKIANEIYRQILAMMDAARARNGEPYL